jgi:tripartite-type tricarboxylate transporter receptor subunit TctC
MIALERDMLSRRNVMLSFGAASIASPNLNSAQAEDLWPSKPVKVVVPYAPGGPTDVICRLVCDKLGQRLPQRIFVENRTGAGGNIGTSLVAKSPPDGYTFLFSNVGFAAVRALYANLDYEPTRDLKAVTVVAEIPMVLLVPPQAPWKTLGEFIIAAKANPRKYTYVSSGGGGALQLVTLQFLKTAGIEMEEVTYRGSAPAVPDLAAGRVDLMIDAGATAFPIAGNGQARALAITSAQRSVMMPDIPTLAEIGLDEATFAVWQAFFAQSSAPSGVILKMQAAISEVLEDTAIRQRLMEMCAEKIIGNSPEDAQAFVTAEFSRWEALLGSGARR